MPYRHEYTTYLNIGSREREVVISYTVTPGWAGDREDPGYPAECTIERVEVGVIDPAERAPGYGTKRTWVPAPAWLIEMIEADPDIHEEMIHEAGEDDSEREAA